MELKNLKRMFEERSNLSLVIENWVENVEPDLYEKLDITITASLTVMGEVIQEVTEYDFDKLLIALDKKCEGEWS